MKCYNILIMIMITLPSFATIGSIELYKNNMEPEPKELPIFYDDFSFFPSSKGIVSKNIETGEVNWIFSTDNKTISDVKRIDDKLFFLDYNACILSISIFGDFLGKVDLGRRCHPDFKIINNTILISSTNYVNSSINIISENLEIIKKYNEPGEHYYIFYMGSNLVLVQNEEEVKKLYVDNFTLENFVILPKKISSNIYLDLNDYYCVLDDNKLCHIDVNGRINEIENNTDIKHIILLNDENRIFYSSRGYIEILKENETDSYLIGRNANPNFQIHNNILLCIGAIINVGESSLNIRILEININGSIIGNFTIDKKEYATFDLDLVKDDHGNFYIQGAEEVVILYNSKPKNENENHHVVIIITITLIVIILFIFIVFV